MKIYIDIQTRSFINLINEGVEAYVSHPSFEILSMVIKQYEYYTTYFNPNFQSNIAKYTHKKNYTTDFNFMIRSIEELNHREDVQFISHFSEFEINCLKKFIPTINQKKWFCTSKESYKKGLPRSLKELSIYFKLNKRPIGYKYLINAYCIPKNMAFTYKFIPFNDMKKLIEYCKLNVDLCEEIYKRIYHE